MESYGYKPPAETILFKNHEVLCEFIIQNQYYLKYLYNNYPETPLIKLFCVHPSWCWMLSIKPDKNGVMSLFGNDGGPEGDQVWGIFTRKYNEWLSQQNPS